MSESNKNFNKVLNTGDVLVTAFGAMIGWGWVVSSGDWIQSAGVIGTVLGFLIGGFMIYFVGMVYAELTAAIPENGGPQAFSNRAFGPVISFVCTWAITLSYIGVVCFEACSLPTIIQYIFPEFLKGYLYTVAGFDVYASWLITAILMTGLITYINIRGVKTAAKLQKSLTIVIGLVGLILIVSSALNGSFNNLEGQVFVGTDIQSIIGNTFKIAVVAPFFLFGFDVIPQVAEEINIPLKKIGKLLIMSIALAVIFYGFVVLAVGYGLNSSEIEYSMQTSGMATADAMAKLFNNSTMAKILIVGGLCGIITSWNSFLMGGSRALQSLANANMIPKIFAKNHSKYKTPVNSLYLIGFISIVTLFFGRPMLLWIANCASFACCVAYLIVSLAFLKLRKKEPQLIRPFKVKNYKLVGILATVMSALLCSLYIFPNTGATLVYSEVIILMVWITLGLIFVLLSKIAGGYNEKSINSR